MIRSEQLVELLKEFFTHDTLEAFHTTKYFNEGVINGAQIFAEGINDIDHQITVGTCQKYDETKWFFWDIDRDYVLIIDKQENFSYYELAGIYVKCRGVIGIESYHKLIAAECEDIGQNPDPWIQLFEAYSDQITGMMNQIAASLQA